MFYCNTLPPDLRVWKRYVSVYILQCGHAYADSRLVPNDYLDWCDDHAINVKARKGIPNAVRFVAKYQEFPFT
jgi:hypothetical protein